MHRECASRLDTRGMRIPIFVVDAFTTKRFSGNPAAVLLLERELDDALLHAIAQENNLSETAFLVPAGDAWHLRWCSA